MIVYLKFSLNDIIGLSIAYWAVDSSVCNDHIFNHW